MIYKFLKEYKLRGIKRILEYFFPTVFLKSARNLKKSESAKNLLRDDLSKNYLFNTKIQHKSTFKQYLRWQMTRTHTTLRTESEGLYALQYGVETVYPLADIRLLQFVYSLPSEMFKPKPYTRVIFRNLTKNMLPDSVRLQPKFSGAMTLAFAEYWMKTQAKDLEPIALKDRFEMYKDPKIETDDFESLILQLKLKLIDYFIEKNSK